MTMFANIPPVIHGTYSQENVHYAQQMHMQQVWHEKPLRSPRQDGENAFGLAPARASRESRDSYRPSVPNPPASVLAANDRGDSFDAYGGQEWLRNFLAGGPAISRENSRDGSRGRSVSREGSFAFEPSTAPARSRAGSASSAFSEFVNGPRLGLAAAAAHTSANFVERHYKVQAEPFCVGGFSELRLVKDRRTGTKRVLKTCTGRGNRAMQQLSNEIRILSRLDHPNIVRLCEYTTDASQLCAVLEHLSGGDCGQLVRQGGKPIEEGFAAKLISQLFLALAHIHARGVVHCDVKPENMVLSRPLSASGALDCKLIDFGLAGRTDQPMPGGGPSGTPAYMSPEVVAGSGPCTPKADVWSAGITACELLAGQVPFGKPEHFQGDIKPIFRKIRAVTHFEEIEAGLGNFGPWPHRSWAAKDFTCRLLIPMPAVRPCASEALGHQWLSEVQAAASREISHDLERSLSRFMGASPVVRRCLLIVAARLGAPNLERLGATFRGIDSKHQGQLSSEDLRRAFYGKAIVGCAGPHIDADDLLEAADQDKQGSITFTEFVAACLYDPTSTSLGAVASRAFEALDEDRDGMVDLENIKHLLCENDIRELQHAGLPYPGPFTKDEWCRCVKAIACRNAAEQTQPVQYCSSRRQNTGILGDLFGVFLCNVSCKQADLDENEFELI
eukprot:gnl/TRDRNA2_/TRDRNA2_84737_c0_seq1.p1 gnl/TRDRNA2_/TRDRNA2_84737_c0~~gnl/TRDRNA2_/TRDRNA2_84737_c0_seq1.p1  ORF type:complete len:674 (-),score=114.65 gnl/TRDRNA2_/TRDRNA2_84737_c0_seq1:67-2088(-)